MREYIEFVKYTSRGNSMMRLVVCKGTAISLQAWIGLEGSRRLRLPDFKTIGTRKW
jgi:hypothetical protein